MKLRIWWIPQIPMSNPFQVEVSSVLEGVKLLTTLAAYDMYQLNNHIKPDYCNAGGLEQFDETENEWVSWDIEDSCGEYFDDPEEYLENSEDIPKELREEWLAFSKSTIDNMNC